MALGDNPVQLARGSAVEVNRYLGPEGEMVVDRDSKTLRLQDGVTEGGVVFVSLDYINEHFQRKVDDPINKAVTEGKQGALMLSPEGALIARPLVGDGTTVDLGALTHDVELDGENLAVGLKATVTRDTAFNAKVTASEFLGKLKGEVDGTTATFSGAVQALGFTGPLTGAVTGNVTGDVTGGLNATGKTVTVDDNEFTISKISGLINALNEIETVVNAGVIQPNFILIFQGPIANIPDGYQLCDGTNGTPDLRDKFVIGAAPGTLNPGSTGGTKTHTHGITIDSAGAHSHGVTVDGHALTIAQMPAHKHANGVVDKNATVFSRGTIPAAVIRPDSIDNNSSDGVLEGLTEEVGDGQTHSHGASSAESGAHAHNASSGQINHVPPYYALAYIMTTA